MPSRVRRRFIALAWLAMVGAASGAHAQDTTAIEGPAAGRVAPSADATAAAPPFLVAGVIVTSVQRSAVLVLLDDTGREIGFIALREGESFGGYRLATVEPARVLLERSGTIVAVPVGRPNTGRVPDQPAGRRSFFIADSDRPPTDADHATQNFLERVFSHPLMQKKLEETAPLLQGRARQDGRTDPDAPGPTPSPKPGQ